MYGFAEKDQIDRTCPPPTRAPPWRLIFTLSHLSVIPEFPGFEVGRPQRSHERACSKTQVSTPLSERNCGRPEGKDGCLSRKAG